MKDYSELIKYLRWLAQVRICETKMVDCHNCEFHGLCTDPDSDESIAEQIVKHNESSDALESAQKRIEELEAAQRWIAVEDGLPVFDQLVCGYMKRRHTIVVCRYGEKVWWSNGTMIAKNSVTHWQPLPKKPEA